MHRRFIVILTALLIFPVHSLGNTRSANRSLSQPTNAKTESQNPPCDFEVVVSEPQFCVVQGRVQDVDVRLIPTAGVCRGSATISVHNLPKGMTREILPTPRIRFKEGIATATVRIDTAGMVKEKLATSTLTLKASKGKVVRTSNVAMSVDPGFDFSIKPTRRTISVYENVGQNFGEDVGMEEHLDQQQAAHTGTYKSPSTPSTDVGEYPSEHVDKNSEEYRDEISIGDNNKVNHLNEHTGTSSRNDFSKDIGTYADGEGDKRADKRRDLSSVDIAIELLGTGCQTPKPVTLSLDTSDTSFIPPVITHEFLPLSIIPPGNSTLSFKMSSESGMGYYGTFETNILGCCTDEGIKRKEKVLLAIMPSFLSMPLPEGLPSESSEDFPPDLPNLPTRIEGGYKIESYDTIMKMLKLPKEIQDHSKKVQEDLATKGYIEVSEEEVLRLKESIGKAHPMGEVLDRLTFFPVDIENTPFRQLHFVGGYPWGGEDDYRRSTMVSRIFTTSNGAIVKLAENDLATSGGGAIYSQEAINEKINGFPAVFVIEKGPSRNAISSIGWTTTTTNYELEMEGDVRATGQYEFFINLARSVTKNTTPNRKTVKTPGSPMADDKGGVLDIR